MWGTFGTVGMFSYIMGGYFTDRFSARKIVTIALVFSSVLHFWISFIPSYFTLLIISGLMGGVAVFAFFPASSKILSYLGEKQDAGKVFGTYYALEGLGGMFINVIGSRAYIVTGNEMKTFILVVRLFASLNLIAAVGCYFLFREIELESIRGNKITFTQIKKVIVRKEVWLIAIITMCNFSLYCSLTYITPYLTEVYGISEEKNLIYAIVRINILSILAGNIFGRMVDWKESALKVIKHIVPIQCLVLFILIGNEMIIKMGNMAILLTMFYAFLTIGIKTICLVLITESKIPMMIVGTVIGVVSFVGYSPDAFFYPVIGRFLSVYGEKGYLYLFEICLVVGVLEMFCSNKLGKVRRDYEKRNNQISNITGI